MVLLSIVVVSVLTGLGFSTIGLGLWISYGKQGIADIANIGFLLTAAFLMLGLSNSHGVDITVALPFVAVGLAIVGFLYYVVFLHRFRHRAHLESALFTFGTLFLIQGLLQYVWGGDEWTLNATYLDVNHDIVGVSVTTGMLVTAGIGIVTSGALYAVFRFTTFGKLAEAVCMNPTRAQLLGVNPYWIHGMLYATAVLCAAIGGYVVGINVSFGADDTLQWFVFAFTLMIFGGRFGPLGVLVAAALLQVFQGVIGYYAGGWEGVATYGLLVVVLVIRPKAIFGNAALD
jgi:branched-subunit amino acid ABC-type transport system permease component